MKADPEHDEDFPFFCDTCGAGLEDEEEANTYAHDGQHFCGTCVDEARRGSKKQGAKLHKLVPRGVLEQWWK